MNEQTPNYDLSDRDFSSILKDTKDPVEALEWGFGYIQQREDFINSAPHTAILIIEKADLVKNQGVSDIFDPTMNPQAFLAYLNETSKASSYYKIAEGREWFKDNNEEYTDHPEIFKKLLKIAQLIYDSSYQIKTRLDQFVPVEFSAYPDEISLQYEDILAELISGEKTDHPIRIEKSKIPEDVPTFTQLVKKFESDSNLLNAVLSLYKYISTPLVHDDFGLDDQSRENWENSVVKKHSNGDEERGKFALSIVNQNKLRLNSLTGLNYGFQILAMFENENWPGGEYLGLLRPEILDDASYRRLNLEEKIQLAKETTQLVYQALRKIYQAEFAELS